MPMSAEEVKELKSLLAVSRKRPLNFGLCIAGNPEESALYLDRKKNPSVLMRQAKKIGKTPKVTCGVIESRGKVITLTCHEDPPGGAAKKIRQFMSKTLDQSVKVILTDADAGVLDSDGEDEDANIADGVAPAAPAETQEPAPAETPTDPTPAVNEASAKIEAVLTGLTPRINQAIEANEKAKAPIEKLLTDIRTDAAEGNGPDAVKRIKQLGAVLDRVLSFVGAGGAAVSLVKLGKARLEWPGTQTDAKAEMDALKRAIQTDYADMPEAASAVNTALAKLDASIGKLDQKLVDQLDEVLNADGPARTTKIDAARKTIAAFNAHISSDPILKEIDGNDIRPETNISAPLQAKLAEISNALGV